MLEYNGNPDEYNQYSNDRLRKIELTVIRIDTLLSKITDVLNFKDTFLESEKEKEIQNLKGQLEALSLLKDSEIKKLLETIRAKNNEISQLRRMLNKEGD